MTRTTTRMTTALAIGGVLTAVAVGIFAATTIWPGGDPDNANGSVPVERLTALDGSWLAINSVGAPKEVVGAVRMRFEDGQLVVETGCNAGRGTVELDDSRLVAGPMMSTKMGCEAPLMEQETWLFAMVEARPRVELSGPYLYVSWDGAGGEDFWLGLEQEDASPAP